MLVAVEAIFDSVYYGNDSVECEIIRHCDRNDFIYNLMKKIHIVEEY